MLKLFVLDVEEFAGLIRCARANAACRVKDTSRGYTVIESDGPLTFRRRDIGVSPAVWYGAFTGGLRGRIAAFGRDEVRIEPFDPVET